MSILCELALVLFYCEFLNYELVVYVGEEVVYLLPMDEVWGSFHRKKIKFKMPDLTLRLLWFLTQTLARFLLLFCFS